MGDGDVSLTADLNVGIVGLQRKGLSDRKALPNEQCKKVMNQAIVRITVFFVWSAKVKNQAIQIK